MGQTEWDVIGVRGEEKIHETMDGTTYSNENDNWMGKQQLRDAL